MTRHGLLREKDVTIADRRRKKKKLLMLSTCGYRKKNPEREEKYEKRTKEVLSRVRRVNIFLFLSSTTTVAYIMSQK
jgi:hypothetical protein